MYPRRIVLSAASLTLVSALSCADMAAQKPDPTFLSQRAEPAPFDAEEHAAQEPYDGDEGRLGPAFAAADIADRKAEPAPPPAEEPSPDSVQSHTRGKKEASAKRDYAGSPRPASGAVGGGHAFAPGLGSLSGAGVGGAPAQAHPVAPEPVAPNAGGTFMHSGVNPLTDTREDRHSTFAIDVDTASYSYARRFLEAGQRPNPGAVRVEEWVNAFHYDYAGPTDSLPFAVHLAGAPSPFVKGRHLVRVGVQGKRVVKAERKPVHLTFLVDVSGSMSSPDKLPLAQRSLHILAGELDERDSVAIVTYAGNNREVLPATKVTREGKQRIHEAIERLTSGGGTHMSSGMELAYQNAHRFLSSGTVSRVIVLSDGDANIGRTSHQEMLKAIKGYVSEGVTMSTVGFGTGNYRDHLMEQLADAGNGNYTYIDSEQAARKAFVEDLTGTLQVIAKDVKIQVEFDPTRVAAYRLVGYENRDIADKDFRNDKVDAGEIGAGHTVTALYEVVLHDGDRLGDASDIATVRLRHKTPRGVKASEISRTLTGAHVKKSFSDLDANTRFAAASALSAEILRGSEHTAHLTLDDARAMADKAAVGPYAEERKELVRLLSKVIDNRPALSQR